MKLRHRELVGYSIASDNFEVIHELILLIFKEMWARLGSSGYDSIQLACHKITAVKGAGLPCAFRTVQWRAEMTMNFLLNARPTSCLGPSVWWLVQLPPGALSRWLPPRTGMEQWWG